MKNTVVSVTGGEVVESTQQSKTCQICNGTGLSGTHKICGNCGGFGYVSQMKVPCQRCKGTGFSGSHLVCERCRGVGYLPKK
jgi:DnaJ-class molecular chaperone